jgi:outer membrane lipoprotein-sorting protein
MSVLRRAAEAPLHTDYEVVQVLTVPRAEGAAVVRVAVWHRRPSTYRMEFLAPRRLAGRVVVDDGRSSWHYEPSLHLLVRGPSLSQRRQPVSLPPDATVRLLGTDVVAGRPSYLLAVLPASGGSVRRLWVDQLRGLVLKSEAQDPERGVYFTTTVTRVSFAPVPEELFRVPRPRGARTVELPWGRVARTRVSELARAVGFSLAAPAELPKGFEYRGGGVAVLGGTRAGLLQFSDGVTTVSLFQLPAGRTGLPPGGEVFRLGPVVVRSYAAGLFRMLAWERQGLRFVAVADAPVALLREFVLATEPDPSGEARKVSRLAAELGVPPDRVADLRDRGLTFTQVRGTLGGGRPAAAAASGRTGPSLVDELEHFQRVVAGTPGASVGGR